MRFDQERVVVVGAGISGLAAADALVREGARVTVLDQREQGELADAVRRLDDIGVPLRTGPHDPSELRGSRILYVSPGVLPDSSIVTAALRTGLEVWGELELGARLASVPYLGVTGTDGKTTTTGMIAECLRASGLDAPACGNIGLPFPTAALEQHDALVVEASSFQLHMQESFHPKVSVLLNIASDHLDWHGSIQSYTAAKSRIFRLQGAVDRHVGNLDDESAARVSREAPCPTVWISGREPLEGAVGYRDGRLISRLSGEQDLGHVDGQRPGYREDAAAAAAAALSYGADPGAVRRGLSAFAPQKHRGEIVATVGGIRFVDNSKATTVHSALAAIACFEGAVLIAGGRSKGQDLSALGSAADSVTAVIAMGEAQDQIAAAFHGTVVRRAGSIEEAVRMGARLAPPGGAVLLAPACASWDMFADYAERGDRFAAAAAALGSGVGVG
jgi:UDP-N-acetylmuramoylalanine--D-glutamate ligase